MQWFNGKLYVGTGRDVNCFSHADDLVQTGAKIAYPIAGCPSDYKDLSLQAEIWQYTPQTKTWLRVYQSPADIPIGNDQAGHPVNAAEDIVFRSFAVFTEADGTQAMYVAADNASPLFDTLPPYNSQGYPNPRILRTTDGINYTPIPMAPGTFMGTLVANSPQQFKVRGFRDLVSYNGKLYATASDFIGTGFIISSSNPSAGNNAWQASSPATASFPVRTVFVYNNYLYVGGGDYRVGPTDAQGKVTPAGYFVYKTTNPTTDISSFTPVITNGAGMPLGQRAHDALSVITFQGQLYVGTDRPTELVRINPDDSWDLVVGPPRDTSSQPHPEGTLYPLSGMGNGFGNNFTGHFYRMGVYNNQLYLGTWDWSTSLADLQATDPLPYFDPVFLYEFGTDIFKTPDGIHWSAITHSGLNDMANFGTRTLESTPLGIYLGTTRPYGGAQVWMNNSALDYNGDGVIDQRDVAILTSAMNKPASGPNDPRDLNQDGVINILDSRILITQCTLPGCALASVPAQLPPPTNLQAVSSQISGNNTAILSWTPSAGAVKYHIYRSNQLPVLSVLPPGGISIPSVTGVGYSPVVIPQDVISGKLQPYCPVPDSLTLPCGLIQIVTALSDNPSLAFPMAWAEITITTTPSYTDNLTPPDFFTTTSNSARYFVRAEDSLGNVSIPSNMVEGPSLAAAPPLASSAKSK